MSIPEALQIGFRDEKNKEGTLTFSDRHMDSLQVLE